MPVGGKRYQFRRMTGAEFSMALETHGLSANQFCRLTGVTPGKVDEFFTRTDLPEWIPVFFAALGAPGAMELARRESESRLLD